MPGAHKAPMARRGDSSRRREAESESPPRPCDHPGCPEAGLFRAPADRLRLREYKWFCLAHVRAYNAAWDFYKGLNPSEIEHEIRSDNGWQRPTWPLGRLGGRLDPALLRDPLGLFFHESDAAPRRPKREEAPAELRAALDVMGLGWPADQPMLKARYKDLAKRFHPDANGGDRAAEEKLKDINRAYSLLRKRLRQELPATDVGAAAAAG